MSDEYRPPLDANTWSHLDERIAMAFNDENGFWQIPETKMMIIRMRCEEAGHE